MWCHPAGTGGAHSPRLRRPLPAGSNDSTGGSGHRGTGCETCADNRPPVAAATVVSAPTAQPAAATPKSGGILKQAMALEVVSASTRC